MIHYSPRSTSQSVKLNQETVLRFSSQIRKRASEFNQPPDSPSRADYYIRGRRSRHYGPHPRRAGPGRAQSGGTPSTRLSATVARFPRVVGMRRRQEHPATEREKNPPTSVAVVVALVVVRGD